MAKIIEGKITGKNIRLAIVVSRFNDFITKRLLNGCLKELKRAGVKDSQLTIVWVPGAFEIPVVAKRLAKKKNIDAVICLGAVIKGQTLHFELIAQSATEGIAQAALLTDKPIIFGVLTTYTTQQAYKRSQFKGDNKGVDAAKAALDMTGLFKKI